MNGKEKRGYLTQYQRVNRRFEKTFKPKILKAIKTILSSLIADIETIGLNAARNNLLLTVMNEKMYEPVKRLYEKVGVYHANANYRFIRSLVAQKSRSEFWAEQIIQYLRQNLLQYAVVKPTETFRNALLEILEEGVTEGMSEYEIIKMLRESGFAETQSQRIVRTEVNRAANTGVLVSAQSFEYEMVKEWLSHRDARTRGRQPNDKNDHYHMNEQRVNLEDDFKDPKSGENISHPSAPGGSAGMVINCRCSMVTVPKRDDTGRLIRRPSVNILPGVPARI